MPPKTQESTIKVSYTPGQLYVIVSLDIWECIDSLINKNIQDPRLKKHITYHLYFTCVLLDAFKANIISFLSPILKQN